MPEDAFLETHRMVKNIYPQLSGYYNFNTHTQLLADSSKKEFNAIKSAVFDFIVQNVSSYVFSDVAEFLKKHSKKNSCVLITMTFDEDEYQFRKVAYSGLADYFSDIIYTAGEPKSLMIKTYMQQLRDPQGMAFLDDRRDWITEAVLQNPGLVGAHMKRKDRRHDEDSGEHVPVTNMAEFDQLLTSL